MTREGNLRTNSGGLNHVVRRTRSQTTHSTGRDDTSQANSILLLLFPPSLCSVSLLSSSSPHLQPWTGVCGCGGRVRVRRVRSFASGAKAVGGRGGGVGAAAGAEAAEIVESRSATHSHAHGRGETTETSKKERRGMLYEYKKDEACLRMVLIDFCSFLFSSRSACGCLSRASPLSTITHSTHHLAAQSSTADTTHHQGRATYHAQRLLL